MAEKFESILNAERDGKIPDELKPVLDAARERGFLPPPKKPEALYTAQTRPADDSHVGREWLDAVFTAGTGPVKFALSLPYRVYGPALEAALGSQEPFYDATKHADEILSKALYRTRSESGELGGELITYGTIAATAPYLLPLLGVDKVLDSETAQKKLSRNQIAMLKLGVDSLMITAPKAHSMVKQYGVKGAAARMLDSAQDYIRKQAGNVQTGKARSSIEQKAAAREALGYDPLQELTTPPDRARMLADRNKRYAEKINALNDRMGSHEKVTEEMRRDALKDADSEARNAEERRIRESVPKPKTEFTEEELGDMRFKEEQRRIQKEQKTGKKRNVNTASQILNRLNNPPADFDVSEAVVAWKKAIEELKKEKDEDIRVDLQAIIKKAEQILDGENLVTAKVVGNYIDSLDVDPQFRKQGIGTLKADAIEANIKRNGFKSAFVLATPESVGFWKKRGYEIKGEQKPNTNILMEKSFEKANKVSSPVATVPPVPAKPPMVPVTVKERLAATYSHVKGKAQELHDKLVLDILPRHRRIAGNGAVDAAANFASAYHAAPDVVNDIIQKVMPEALERLPNYIRKKVENQEVLSKKESELYSQALNRNRFGRMLVYDRIIAIFKTAESKAKTQQELISKLTAEREAAQREYQKQIAGKPGAEAQHIVPDLANRIKDYTDEINKASNEFTYQKTKAKNVADAHDLRRYVDYVRKHMHKFDKELKAWNEHVNPYLDSLYDEIRGDDGEGAVPNSENTGFFTGARVNLIHADMEGMNIGEVVSGKKSEGGVSSEKGGASVGKDRWDREAKGTGDYTTSLHTILKTVIADRTVKASKLRYFKALEDAGVGKLVEVGTNPPDFGKKEMRGLKDIIQIPEKGPDGKTTIKNYHLYVDKGIVPEVTHLLRGAEGVEEIPGLRFLTAYQILSPVDFVTHAMNVMSQITRHGQGVHRILNKIPGIASIDAGIMLAKYVNEGRKNTEAYISKKRWMHENGLIRDAYHFNKYMEWLAKKTGNPSILESGTGEMLLKIDTASRMYMSDIFDRLVADGKMVDSMVNRRDFINNLGNYNGMLMESWASSLRRTGAAPFIVAGRTFVRNAGRGLTGHPGAETTSRGVELKMRAEHLARPMVAVAIAYAINSYLSGNGFGPDGTPFGAIALSNERDEQGRLKYTIQLLPQEFERAMNLGGKRIFQGIRSGQSVGQIAGAAIGDLERGLIHPVVGPAASAVISALSGHDIFGHPVPAEKNKGAQVVESLTAVNPLLQGAGKAALHLAKGQPKSAGKDILAAGKAFSDPFARAAGMRTGYKPQSRADVMINERSRKFTEGMDERTKEQITALNKIDQKLSAEPYSTAPDDEKTWAAQMKAMHDSEGGKELIELWKAGKITEAQARRHWKERNLSDQQKRFNRLTMLDALEVWSSMTPKEREANASLLEQKMEKQFHGFINGREAAIENELPEYAEQYEKQLKWIQGLYDNVFLKAGSYDKMSDPMSTYYHEEE